MSGALGRSDRIWLRVAAWFLALSYGIGAPVTALAELRGALLSERLALPPELIYATCGLQLVSVPALFKRAWAPWAALVLTGITVGAIVVHLGSEAPIRAVPALVYTVVQIGFGIASHRTAAREGG